MKLQLKDLQIDRVALVRRGSNPQADIVFFKAHKSAKETEEMKISKIDVSKLSETEQASLTALFKKLGITQEETEPTVEELLKAHPGLKKHLDTLTTKQTELEETLAAIKKTAKGEKTPEELAAEERERVLKTVSPEVRAVIESTERIAKAAQEDAKRAEERAKRAEADALIEKDARAETAFAKSVEADVKNLVGKPEDTGRLLYRVKKAIETNGSKDDYDALMKILKSGNAAAEKLADETGEDSSESGFGKAYDELKDKAERMVAADTTGAVTFAKAFAKVSAQNPKLASQYRKEKQESERRTH